MCQLEWKYGYILINEIVFIEVKTCKASRLTRRQQEIKDAIKRGKIKWVSMRVNHDTQVSGSPITIDDSQQVTAPKRETATLLKSLRGKT